MVHYSKQFYGGLNTQRTKFLLGMKNGRNPNWSQRSDYHFERDMNEDLETERNFLCKLPDTEES